MWTSGSRQPVWFPIEMQEGACGSFLRSALDAGLPIAKEGERRDKVGGNCFPSLRELGGSIFSLGESGGNMLCLGELGGNEGN